MREPTPKGYAVTFTQEGHLYAWRQEKREKGKKKGAMGRKKEKRFKKDCIIFKCVIHKIRIDHNFVEYLFLC